MRALTVVLLMILLLAVIGAHVFVVWYLIQIGHAPNWAVALYIGLTAVAAPRVAQR